MVMDDLFWTCRKIGQGHHRVIIFIYIVVLYSTILRAKFVEIDPPVPEKKIFEGFLPFIHYL